MRNYVAAIAANPIPYCKEFRQIAGSVTGAILLQQLDFYFRKKPNGFYKFLEPCNREKYNEGDSWTEELGFSASEFRSAFDQIGLRHASKTEYEDAKHKFKSDDKEFFYCSYHDRMTGLTHYFRNHQLLDALLDKMIRPPEEAEKPGVFRNSTKCSSVTQQSAVTERKDVQLHNKDSETTTETTTETVVAETPITPEPPQPPSPTTTAAVAAPKGEKPAASAKPSAREAESTACEILHSFVRRNNPHWSPTIHDQETINAKVPASELPAFSDFVSNWFLDYPNTRHASKILTAYAEQSAKRKLETERASQGANDLKELARRIEYSRQQDIKLANERRANRGNDQPVASGTARPASEPPPARRPYCLPESFVGTVWATPDARRDAVRMVEDQEGDELPDCFRPMGVVAQPVHATVNA